MSSTTRERPRQVTMLATVVGVGSFLVVLLGFQRITSLRSLDTKRAVEEFLAEPPGSGMGLGVEEALGWLQIAASVAVVCAGALTVLAFWLWQGDRAARIVASVLAPLLMLTGLTTGGFLSSMVVFAVILMWTSPARHWFDGTPMPQEVLARADSTPALPERDPAPDDAATAQAGASPFGRAPAGPEVVPPTVRMAILITWLSSSLVASLCLASIPFLLTMDGQELLDQTQAQNPDLSLDGLTPAVVVAVVVVLLVALALWSVGAMVLAWLVRRRHEWARITLVVSAAMVALTSLVMVVAAPVLVVPMVASVAAAALLLRRESALWCRRGTMGP